MAICTRTARRQTAAAVLTCVLFGCTTSVLAQTDAANQAVALAADGLPADVAPYWAWLPADTETAIVARDVAFTAPMERSRLPIAYRLSTLLVAMVMVLLPLIYVGLIAAIWYGVYYHAVNHTGLASVGTGRARAFMGLVYLAPLFIGPVVTLFMVKPLFARPARRERSRSLTRESEPLLFAFVDRVCETVRAAKPTRIDVDCDVNASARSVRCPA